MSEHITVDAKKAAEMLDLSESTFMENVAPFVPAADLAKPGAKRRVPRWMVRDLEAFAERRKVRTP